LEPTWLAEVLQHPPGSRSFLTGPMSDRLPPPPPGLAPSLPRQPAAPPEGHPSSIPGYEVLAELGRGGMGVVYKAPHLKLNRVVARKMVLAGSHAAGADLSRFQGEAEAIARLQHPGVVQIFEVGQHGGLPFFSMEFCAGGSLDQKLAGTPLPPR